MRFRSRLSEKQCCLCQRLVVDGLTLGYALSMRRYLPVLLLFFCFSATAEVYKWVDADGNIVYSDKEVEGATRVELSKTITFTPTATASPTSAQQKKPKNTLGYTEMAITQPAMNETIRNDSGDVAVTISLISALMPGHSITLYLDGKEKMKGMTQTATTFTNLERGTHTLKASVIDQNGAVLISSITVIFHLKREVADKTEEPAKDNSNAFKPGYSQGGDEKADYDKDYSKDYRSNPSKDYSSDGTYEDGADKFGTGTSSDKNYKSGPSTYTPNYNQK